MHNTHSLGLHWNPMALSKQPQPQPHTLSNDIILSRVTPNKSIGDTQRDYRVITLTNGLQAVLVHDDETDKAAAGLAVAVGHFSDPVPGLAHLLEHLLFMGSETYPDVNAYNSFLNANGGSSNAYTATESTVYYFDVSHDALDGSLDRFAHFFIDPLFDSSTTDKEINAVNNENAKNLNNDGWRSYQLLKSTSNPKHPFNSFGTGNLKTLKTDPEQQGMDIRSTLIAFHRQHYSANLMTLAVVGRESLDELERMVVSKFSKVRNSDKTIEHFGSDAFAGDGHNKIYKIVPVKDIHYMSMLWPLPALKTQYQKKPASLLSHLLGHEGFGSIFCFLKMKGWANGLSSGPAHSCNDFAAFNINIDLTEEGLSKIEEISQVIYQYINLLRNASESMWHQVYKEASELAQINFDFKSKENPQSYVTTLVENLHIYGAENVLSGSWLYYEFDLKTIKQILDCLTPDNLRLSIFSQSFKGQTTEVEKWYATEFSVQAFSPEFMQKLHSPGKNEELALPAPNPFIATDFRVKHQKKPEPQMIAPERLLYDSHNAELGSHQLRMDLWFKPDTIFLKPKANVYVKLTSPVSYVSPRHHLMTILYTSLAEDALNEFSYDATLAGLRYSLSTSTHSILLTVKGYNHKLRILLEAVLAKMRDLEVKEDRFALIKEQLARELRNSRLNQPYQQAVSEQTSITQLIYWDDDQLIDVVDSITSDDVRKFIPEFRRTLRVEMLVHGNVEHEEAKQFADSVESVLDYQPLFDTELPDHRVVMLESDRFYLRRVAGKNAQDINSAALALFQLGMNSPKMDASISLLAHIAKERAFDQLRSTEQLGYLVWSGASLTHNVLNWRVIVQSSDYDAAYLDSRIEGFLVLFRKELDSMSQEAFDQNLQAVIAHKLVKDKTLSEVTGRAWIEISRRRYTFDRREQVVDELRKLTKSELLDFFDVYIGHSGSRRKLSVQVFANKFPVPSSDAELELGVIEPRPPVLPQKVTPVSDINVFKRESWLYPSHHNSA